MNGKWEAYDEEVVVRFTEDLEPGTYYIYANLGDDPDGNPPEITECSMRIYSLNGSLQPQQIDLDPNFLPSVLKSCVEKHHEMKQVNAQLGSLSYFFGEAQKTGFIVQYYYNPPDNTKIVTMTTTFSSHDNVDNPDPLLGDGDSVTLNPGDHHCYHFTWNSFKPWKAGVSWKWNWQNAS